MRRDKYWDYEACQCNSKSVVPRVVEDQLACDYYPVSLMRGSRTVDVAGWVLLGSCLAMVGIPAAATWHYRFIIFVMVAVFRWGCCVALVTCDVVWCCFRGFFFI